MIIELKYTYFRHKGTERPEPGSGTWGAWWAWNLGKIEGGNGISRLEWKAGGRSGTISLITTLAEKARIILFNADHPDTLVETVDES